MELSGHIQNGVVVFDQNTMLPEGVAVTVLIPTPGPPIAPVRPETQIVCEPGKLPYVHGGIPGTWHLTNEKIEAIFEEEEIEALRKQWNVPS